MWRNTPLLCCRSRRAACWYKPSSQFSARWQDAVVWTRARAWKWRQEEKTSTETWKETEEGERTDWNPNLFLFIYLFFLSQQTLACARPSPVQVTPPASRLVGADTCASVLGATWGKTASWSRQSASQTGNSFHAEHNVRSFLFIIISISDQYREHCRSLSSWGTGTGGRKLD